MSMEDKILASTFGVKKPIEPLIGNDMGMGFGGGNMGMGGNMGGNMGGIVGGNIGSMSNNMGGGTNLMGDDCKFKLILID